MFWFSGPLTELVGADRILALSLVNYVVRFFNYAFMRRPLQGLPAEGTRFTFFFLPRISSFVDDDGLSLKSKFHLFFRSHFCSFFLVHGQHCVGLHLQHFGPRVQFTLVALLPLVCKLQWQVNCPSQPSFCSLSFVYKFLTLSVLSLTLFKFWFSSLLVDDAQCNVRWPWPISWSNYWWENAIQVRYRSNFRLCGNLRCIFCYCVDSVSECPKRQQLQKSTTTYHILKRWYSFKNEPLTAI